MSYASFFNKNLLKKLVYALQKYNTGEVNLIKPEEDSNPKKQIEYTPLYMTEAQDLSGVTENTPQETDSAKKIQAYKNLTRKLRSSIGPRKSAEKVAYPLAQIDGNNTSYNGQERMAKSNAFKLSKRNQSFDVDNQVTKDDNDSAERSLSKYNDVFHQRLEVIRKTLVEENIISQKYKDVQTININNTSKSSKEKIPKV